MGSRPRDGVRGSEQEGLDACARRWPSYGGGARLTLFDGASDLCELNRHRGGKPMRVDEDPAHTGSAGAFKRATGCVDVAVEPLMRVWDFTSLGRRTDGPELPSPRGRPAAVVELDGERGPMPECHTQLDFGGWASLRIDGRWRAHARGLRRALST